MPDKVVIFPIVLWAAALPLPVPLNWVQSRELLLSGGGDVGQRCLLVRGEGVVLGFLK